jgi:hypothetical protein
MVLIIEGPDKNNRDDNDNYLVLEHDRDNIFILTLYKKYGGSRFDGTELGSIVLTMKELQEMGRFK